MNQHAEEMAQLKRDAIAEIEQARECAALLQQEVHRITTLYNEANSDRFIQSNLVGKCQQIYNSSFDDLIRKFTDGINKYKSEVRKTPSDETPPGPVPLVSSLAQYLPWEAPECGTPDNESAPLSKPLSGLSKPLSVPPLSGQQLSEKKAVSGFVAPVDSSKVLFS